MMLKGKLPHGGLTLNIGSSANLNMVPSGCKIINIDIESCSMPNFVRARAERLPFKDNVFSNVLFFDVLEHIREDHAAVTEAWRTLRSGGRLYATIPCSEDDFFMLELPPFLKYVDWDEMERQWGHVRRGYTTRQVVEELFGQYFNLVHIERGVANFTRIGLQLYFLRGWESLWYSSPLARSFLKMLNYLDSWLCCNKGHCIFAVFERVE